MPNSFTTANLIRALIAAIITAGSTASAILGALGAADQGVNWLAVGAAAGGSFFGTLATMLGMGPNITKS